MTRRSQSTKGAGQAERAAAQAPVSSLPAERGTTEGGAGGPAARLHVDVEWANIARASGDVFVVGHYVGVLPQNAEWALDCALSGVTTESSATRTFEESRMVLTDLTRRGDIRGALGEVTFFPWAGRGHIVLAGMGRLGSFNEAHLKTLSASVAQRVWRLLPNSVVSTVLVGSGYGNLSVTESVSGLITGVAGALAADPSLGTGRVRIVEYRLDRAYEIHSDLTTIARRVAADTGIGIRVEDQVIESSDTGGVIPVPFGFSLILALLAQACHDGDGSPLSSSLTSLVNGLPAKLRPAVREALGRLGKQRNEKLLGLAFRMSEPEPSQDGTIADRMSFRHDGSRVEGAAITNLTTVTASTLEVGMAWIDRVVESLRAPTRDTFQKRGRTAFRSLVHPVLREKLLLPDPLVLELDRTMARVPWELVHDGDLPLGVKRPVSRQLRTAYGPRPSMIAVRLEWKALVIGDPDGSLPASAEEAAAVAKILISHGVKTELRIGPPSELGLGSRPDILAADVYDVLELLQSGEFDIVHFAGHAFFQADFPDRSGWVFKGEVLTASKLEGVEHVPRLVVANACVSAGVSNTQNANPAAQQPASTAPRSPASDAGIVASLADEFFRRGVADYIGTAWEVPEGPAKSFAEQFYKEFFANWSGRRHATASPTTLGEAVQRARRALFDRSAEFGEHATVWAAYQHYGDPTRTLDDYRS